MKVNYQRDRRLNVLLILNTWSWYPR